MPFSISTNGEEIGIYVKKIQDTKTRRRETTTGIHSRNDLLASTNRQRIFSYLTHISVPTFVPCVTGLVRRALAETAKLAMAKSENLIVCFVYFDQSCVCFANATSCQQKLWQFEKVIFYLSSFWLSGMGLFSHLLRLGVPFDKTLAKRLAENIIIN